MRVRLEVILGVKNHKVCEKLDTFCVHLYPGCDPRHLKKMHFYRHVSTNLASLSSNKKKNFNIDIIPAIIRLYYILTCLPKAKLPCHLTSNWRQIDDAVPFTLRITVYGDLMSGSWLIQEYSVMLNNKSFRHFVAIMLYSEVTFSFQWPSFVS